MSRSQSPPQSYCGRVLAAIFKAFALTSWNGQAGDQQFVEPWAGRYSGLCPVMALSQTNTLYDVLDGIHGDQPIRVSAFHAATALEVSGRA